MVIFRDPDTHRHARAAVLATLGIQRRTAQINAELQEQFEPIERGATVRVYRIKARERQPSELA